MLCVMLFRAPQREQCSKEDTAVLLIKGALMPISSGMTEELFVQYLEHLNVLSSFLFTLVFIQGHYFRKLLKSCFFSIKYVQVIEN